MNIKKRFFLQMILLILVIGAAFMMTFKPSGLFGQKLSTQSGIVQGLNNTVEEHIVKDTQDVRKEIQKTYTYMAQFQLDGQPMVAKFKDPYQINEGDYIQVSGVQTAEYFDVVAYRNDTLQYTGSTSWWATALAGLVFSCATGFIYFQKITIPKWYENGFFLIFFGVGIFLIVRGFFIKEALDLLNTPK